MEKLNIERDILNILKNKDDEGRNHAILSMLNGTYQYEIEYLNNIPYHLMLVYLEKVMMMVTNNEFLPSSALKSLEILVDFSLKIPNYNFQNLEKQNKTTLKYDLLVMKENISQNKKRIKMVATFLLTITIFSSLYYHLNKTKNEADTLEILPTPSSISTTEERVRPHDNILAASIIDVMPLEENVIVDETNNEKAYLNNIVEVAKPIKMNQKIEDDYIVPAIPVNESEEKNVGMSLDDYSKEEKIKLILEKYNLTEEQFNIIKAIVIAEAQSGSYKDGYAVINTIYNRTVSNLWSSYISSYYGKDVGTNLYYQAITPGQFIVYEKGAYKDFLSVQEGPVYDAIIDFLVTEETIHDYLSFLSSGTEMTREYEQFDTRGNKYFDRMPVEDRVDTQTLG